jgi:tetratricopeptide (TPR) repeat protein
MSKMMKPLHLRTASLLAAALMTVTLHMPSATAGAPAPTDKRALMNEGARLAKRGDYNGAAVQFEKAALLAPTDANIFFNLGQIYEQSNPGRCVLRYNRFLQLEPAATEAPAVRAAVSACTNKIAKAGAIHITDLLPPANIVLIDGVAVTEGPSVLPMAPGEYTIHVDALDHDPFNQQITIRTGETTEVSIKLVAQATYGTLTIKVNRPGATITIDGQPNGIAPLAAPLRVTTGKHLVVIEAAGFHKWQRNVTIEKELEEEIDARLQAASVDAR